MPTKTLVVSAYVQYMLIALGALLLFTFVWQLGGVLLTFLLAAVLAYALNPLVRRLETWRILRVVAVVGVFVGLIAAVLAALLVIIIPAAGQVRALIEDPTVITDGVARLLGWAQDHLPEEIRRQIATVDQATLTEFAQSNAPSAGRILNGALGLVGGVFGVFGTILNLVIMLIISIYILLDKERLSRSALGAVPETVRDQAIELFRTVEDTLVKYLKAQLLLCATMGTIGFAIAYLTFSNYALWVGLWIDVTEIIPVFGPFLGAIPAVALALFSGGITQALLVALLFFLAQQLEGNVLRPNIMGGTVGVHPLWVLFATLAASALYGAVFAVPIVAIIFATLCYLRETLLFQRWRKTPVAAAVSAAEEEPVSATRVPSEKPAGLCGSPRRGG